ncbi:MAG: hypothetical protein RL701_7273 [Pseudomonadota bacterium]
MFALLERYNASELGLLADEYEAVVALAGALPWFSGALAAAPGVGAWCATEADLERARAFVAELSAQR